MQDPAAQSDEGNAIKTDRKRRRLIVATAAVGGTGLLAAAAPFLSGLAPTARAKRSSAPIEIDIADLAAGQLMTVEWRGEPVWVLNRTPDMLSSLAVTDRLLDPESILPQQPEDCRNAARSIRRNIFVVMGVCTHFGCTPTPRFFRREEKGLPVGWRGGFVCSCHGAAFDFAGRVFKDTLASKNLRVPPHRYLSETRLLIGESGQGQRR